MTNPPGLATIAYRAGDFSSFRRALLEPLPGEESLGAWAPAPGDLGLQVLEWWAYLGDVLTFYNERIANESYLRTAKSARRLADLVALIGYAPRPGVAATGQLAALRSSIRPNEPLAVPASMPVSSTATPGVPAQSFEVQGAWSFPGPSNVAVSLPPDTTLALNSSGGPASVLLAGKVTGVKLGDQLLLVATGWDGTDDSTWAWVVVDSVSAAVDPSSGQQNTLVGFTSAASFGSASSAPAPVRPIEHLPPRFEVSGASQIAAEVSSLNEFRAVTDIEAEIMPEAMASKALATTGASRRAAVLGRSDAEAIDVGIGPEEVGPEEVSPEEVSPKEVSGLEESILGSAALAALFRASTVPPATSFQLLAPRQSTAMWNQNGSPSGEQAVTNDGTLVVHLAASVRSITPGEIVLFDAGTSAAPSLAMVASISEWLWTLPYPAPSSGSSTSSSPSSSPEPSSAPGSPSSSPEPSSPSDSPSSALDGGSIASYGSSASGGSGGGSSSSGASASATPPPVIVIAHSALTLTSPDAGTLVDYVPTTVAVRYGFKAVGTIIGIPATSLASLPVTVGLPGGSSGGSASWVPPAGGTAAILQDATGAGVLVSATSAGTGLVQLSPSGPTPSTLSPPLAVPLQLLLDLVPVSQGTTVPSEVLGSGNAALTNQSFTLKRAPLTYLSKTGPSQSAASQGGSQSGSSQGGSQGGSSQAGGGPPWSDLTSTLVVYVGGIAWSEVPSFYGQGPSAQVYTVTIASDGSATVSFGDGVNGARLPTGSGNVVANYRYGSGAASPPAGRLTTVLKPQPNLASLANPIAVSGGADPQASSDVRQDAPASVFTFGRAVSAVDYEVIAAQAAGVSLASAVWGYDAATQRSLVAVYVGDPDATAAVAAAQAALAGADDPNRPISVLPAQAIELSLSCTLIVAANRQLDVVQAAAQAALSDPVAGPFSPTSLGIGQRLYASALDAALMVPGVLAVHDLDVSSATAVLDDVLDPGTGAYFALGQVTIAALSSGGGTSASAVSGG